MNGNLTSVCGSLSSPLGLAAKRCKTSRCPSLHKLQVVFLGWWQRGSGGISLGRGMDKRLIIRRGEVTWFRKRGDRAVGWESFNACCSFFSSCDNQPCNQKAELNSNNRFSSNLFLSHKPWYVDWAKDKTHPLGNRLLGRRRLGRGGGEEVSRWDSGEKPSSGNKSVVWDKHWTISWWLGKVERLKTVIFSGRNLRQ